MKTRYTGGFETMNCTKLSLAATTLALLSGILSVFAPDVACAQQMAKKGTTPYVTHFIFRPLMSIDIPGLGTATKSDKESSSGCHRRHPAKRCW